MATILRLADAAHASKGASFNFDDLDALARRHESEAKAEAARIVAEARARADAIRREAADAGRREAAAVVERSTAERLAPALAALRQAGDAIRHARQSWLSHWEKQAVHLSAAMAARVIRGELRGNPDIPLALVREALELAAGSPNIRLYLNPDDHKTIGAEVRSVIDAMSAVGEVELISDAAISAGGCRVETRFGTIDQQFESQLNRIEEELSG